MNYLHAGSAAPQIKVEAAGSTSTLDTTWRLLWRDERYCDGAVPSEENNYLFNKPDEIQPPAPIIWEPHEIILVESGLKAPADGKWLLESDLTISITLRKGEKLPLYAEREVRWVLS